MDCNFISRQKKSLVSGSGNMSHRRELSTDWSLERQKNCTAFFAQIGMKLCSGCALCIAFLIVKCYCTSGNYHSQVAISSGEVAISTCK